MHDSIIYKRLPAAALACRPGAALDYGVADLHEAMGAVQGRRTLMSPTMRPLNPGLKIAGAAVTALNYAGDNLMVQKALLLAEPGQVVVLSNGGGLQGALVGEMMATYALKKGIAGIVVDGPIRDTDALRKLQLPIWSTSVSASHPERRGPGAVNIPLPCAGITVRPGDIVMADDDGVIAIPPADFERVLAGARQRVEKEARILAALRDGGTLYELSGANAVFDALQIDERDTSWEDDPQRDPRWGRG
jgi:4-hydroxy-4-methyl-2-oxoglutarate aldolase